MDKEIMEMASNDFDAELTKEQVMDMEQAAQDRGVERRIALSTMSMSRDQLVSSFRDDPGLALDIVESLSSYEKHLDACIAVARSAGLRMLVVAAAIEMEGSHE